MSKARTLADFISDGSEFADGTISVAEVSGAAPLASPTFTGNVSVGDNVQIRLGDSSDLQIYHDGSASYVDDQGEGPLKIKATDFRIKNAADTKNYLRADDGGAVSIYYDNSLKLATATDGVDITGDVGATTATITGKTTTDELDLNAIAATISDTAVDIFVYDTRKDSDGGAWRKRTQHTSWYNETLNTATRGSRKEFPAVAVIVAESTTITIYDGDDPDLPMWMVFNANGSTYSGLRYQARATNAITAINGILYTANGTTDGVYYADFLKDHTWRIHTSNWYGPVAKTLAGRNEAIATSDVPVQTKDGLVQFNANDIAATILPNAPIDAATGLPVPTIAVATDGGVSVIKDDGTVVDITRLLGTSYPKVEITSDGKIFYNSMTGDYWHVIDIPTSDINDGTVYYQKGQSEQYYGGNPAWLGDLQILGGTSGTGISSSGNQLMLGTTEALHRIESNPDAPSTGMTNFTTSSYNTGWMNGNIKLATLSDTDDTDVTGSELVTNGTFDTDVSGWSAGNSATLSLDTNRLKIQSGSAYSYAYQTMTVVVGKTYTVSADLVSGDTNARLRVGTGPNSTAYLNGDILWGPSVHTHTFTATSTSLTITLLNQDADGTDYTIWDNISVRLAEEDRSVNGNGLQVFGTVTKTPVATGADLVGYKGTATGGNGLVQPYNSDLDFGTDLDFNYSFWVYSDSSATYGANTYIFERSNIGDTGNNRIECRMTTSTSMDVYTNNVSTGFVGSSSIGVSIAANTWSKVDIGRRGGTGYIYVNGVLKSSGAHSGNLTDTSARLVICNRAYFSSLNSGFNAPIALLRISATAPSPEQIARIYNDEKHLFTEGAQATLYGSSDSVTALAFDDTTNLLHVGTSAGRSVFQGLRRVDNTTTAVTAAISASNGLVADE